MPSIHLAPLCIAAAAVAGLAASAPPAGAAVEIGQAATPIARQSCDPTTNVPRAAGSPDTPAYTVPAGGGTITSWSVHGGVSTNPVKLKVIRDDAGVASRVVAESGREVPQQARLTRFAARIPVRPGDKIALFTAGGDACTFPTQRVGDTVTIASGDVAVGSPVIPSVIASARQVNVAASVEPDADGDGFGDETQDRCPTDATRLEPCLAPVPPPAPADPSPQPTPTPAPMPAPTPAPALPAVPRDDTAPIVVALAASRQRLRRSHALTLVASSSEPASLTATARTAIRGVALRPVVVDVAPRRRVAIRLRLTRAGARRVRAALARGKRVVSTVTVTARDSAGNQSSRRLRIRITR